MNPLLLVVLFTASAILGYFIVRNIPALLHTPLMSGMNALSGVTVLGAIIATFTANGRVVALVLALIATVIAMVNVVGGFALTHKMLNRFIKKRDKKEAEDL